MTEQSTGSGEGPAGGLPEAFHVKTDDDAITVVEDNDPGSKERERTSTGMNVADEGSAESFPASDVPSTMPPTTASAKPGKDS